LRVGGKWTCIKATNRKGRDVNTTFSEDEIERAIRRLSMIDIASRPDIWFGMRFMEHFGVDLSLNYRMIRQYLTGKDPEWWEFDTSFTPERVQKIMLVLRDRLRADLNLPPLTDLEKQNWQFVPNNWTFYKVVQFEHEDAVREKDMEMPSLAQIEAAREILECEYPEVVDFMKNYLEFQAQDRVLGGWYDKYLYKVTDRREARRWEPDVIWYHSVVDHCFQRVVGSSGRIDIFEGSKQIQRQYGLRWWETPGNEESAQCL
jgi:hypothetical protein